MSLPRVRHSNNTKQQTYIILRDKTSGLLGSIEAYGNFSLASNYEGDVILHTDIQSTYGISSTKLCIGIGSLGSTHSKGAKQCDPFKTLTTVQNILKNSTVSRSNHTMKICTTIPQII